jgi:hypothetical protein
VLTTLPRKLLGHTVTSSRKRGQREPACVSIQNWRLALVQSGRSRDSWALGSAQVDGAASCSHSHMILSHGALPTRRRANDLASSRFALLSGGDPHASRCHWYRERRFPRANHPCVRADVCPNQRACSPTAVQFLHGGGRMLAGERDVTRRPLVHDRNSFSKSMLLPRPP